MLDKISKILISSETKKSWSMTKGSLIAIIIGLGISFIPILLMDGTPLAGFKDMFTIPLEEANRSRTIARISVYIILGIAVGVSFKTGLFNIGASGQFLAGGAATVMLGILFSWNQLLSIPLLIIIAALVGGLLAALAGILKAFFNVHEVVGTILLNWITFFVVKFIFAKEKFNSGASNASLRVNDSMRWNLNGYISSDYLTIFGIAIVIAIIVFIIFKYTTLGYKLRVNGFSTDAAKYAGISYKWNTVISMSISGALAGIAGFIFYNTIQGQMPDLGTQLPAQGFEAITVTLLAFSNPIAAIFSGIFFGTMQSGIVISSSSFGVSAETLNIISGIIIFTTALATVFMRFEPLVYIQNKLILNKSESYIKTKNKVLKSSEVKRKKVIKEISLLNYNKKVVESRLNEIRDHLEIEINKIESSKTSAAVKLKNKRKAKQGAADLIQKEKLLRYDELKLVLKQIKKNAKNNIKLEGIKVITRFRESKSEKNGLDNQAFGKVKAIATKKGGK